MIQIIGFISATLTTMSFVPQAVKTWKTRSTDDLSPLMFGMFFLGVLGWLIYGIINNDLPIILANVVTLCLAGIIMYFIITGKSMHRIIHVAIYVNDLEMMKDFYTENFSAKAVSKYENESKKFSSYFLSFSSGPKLELMHNPDVKKDNSIYSGHFAISVGSKKKVDILSEKLKAKNVTVRSEPRITGDGCYESTILDPEFNIVEITV